MAARTRSRTTARASSNRLTALPEALQHEIFTYASSLRPLDLTGFSGELLSEPRERYPSGIEGISDPELRPIAERQLRALPSMLRREAADTPARTRIEALIVTAGACFLRAVSPAILDAVDGWARATHVRLLGCPLADATTYPLDLKEPYRKIQQDWHEWLVRAVRKDTENPSQEDWESPEAVAARRRKRKEQADEIEAAGGFDAWFEAKYKEGPADNDIGHLWDDRTRHRSAIGPFPSGFAPQKALIDRVHVLLAHRACVFVEQDDRTEGDFFEALYRTFYGRASTLPWTIDAWHVYVTRCPGVTESFDDEGPGEWGREAVTFDAADARCQALCAFAAELAPAAAAGRLRGASRGLTTRVDVFGAPTRWVDRDADGERIGCEEDTYYDSDVEGRKEVASREYLLGPHLGGSGPLSHGDSTSNGRNEPPADVLAGFCAFSFRPSDECVHFITDRNGEYGPWEYPNQLWTFAFQGGFAARAVDLSVPARASPEAVRRFYEVDTSDDDHSDDDWGQEKPPKSVAASRTSRHVPTAPIVLHRVIFECDYKGHRVHLVYRFARGGGRFKLMVTGAVAALLRPPPTDGCLSTIEADRVLDGGTYAPGTDRVVFPGDSLIDGEEIYYACINRRWNIAEAAERQRAALPRRSPREVMPQGLDYLAHPHLERH